MNRRNFSSRNVGPRMDHRRASRVLLPRRLKIFALAVILYFLLVPIIPMHEYYSGNFWSQAARDQVCPSGTPLWFDSFSAPAGSSSPRPLPSSSFVVFGLESLGAWLFNFGLVSPDRCGFTALTTYPGDSALLLPMEIASLAFIVVMFLLLRDYLLNPAEEQGSKSIRHGKEQSPLRP